METNDTTNVTTNPANETPDVEASVEQEVNDSPTKEELMARIAEAEARAAKVETENKTLKRANDSLSKEAAENKRKVIANMTAEQQAQAERDEQFKRMQDELAEAKREIDHQKAVTAYSTFSDDEKIVENMIEAVSNADHASIAAILTAEKQRAVNAAKAEWMKSRPPVNAGDPYSSMTKEQIMAIEDPTERRKAIAMNLELFENNSN